jgi:hypothetical protein
MRKLLILLIITLTGCLLFGCEAKKTEPAATDAGAAFTIREVMQSMVMPQADTLWNAVSTNVTDKGVETKAPSNDDEWDMMRHAAVTVSEAMNVVLMPGRKVAKPGEQSKDPTVELTPEQIQELIDKDRADFAKFAHELQAAVAEAIKAIDAKNAEALSTAGGGIDTACENCHKKYWYPNDKGAASAPAGATATPAAPPAPAAPSEKK